MDFYEANEDILREATELGEKKAKKIVGIYGKNNEKKMKLPIKCWVHTHPFGKAYFSGTDISTINTWKPHMMSAIVLGDNEHQIWQKVKPGIAKHIRYVTETIVELGTKNKIDKMVEELI